ncbi:MAG: DUF1579 family protein [Alphaproteobacteria bacterium]|nr:DUF1579 family protein [Alphaproteobacteria bacterium]
MNKGLIVTLTLLSLIIIPSISAISAEKKTSKTFQPHKSQIELLEQSAIEKLENDGNAAEQSAVLDSLGGEWNFNLKYWSKEGADPQESTGTIVNEMVLDKRFLSGTLSAILNIGGQNIHLNGMLYTGYDTAKKAYTSVWMDSLHTGMIIGTGQYDSKKHILEEKGNFTFPLLDKERRFRSVLEITDDKTHKILIYISGKDGKEYKAIEIDFSRKQ